MYDVVVVGGGVAGLSAALFTSKAGLKTIVLDNGKSQITRVSSVQNIPGVPDGISGVEWIKQTKSQVEKFNATIQEETVSEIIRLEDGSFEIKGTNSYQTKYLIVASNVDKGILAPFGFEEDTNQLVPNGKAKAIKTTSWDGQTSIENLYLAGLITEIPSQASVSLGHGAAVGIAVATKELGKPFMWHDL